MNFSAIMNRFLKRLLFPRTSIISLCSHHMLPNIRQQTYLHVCGILSSISWSKRHAVSFTQQRQQPKDIGKQTENIAASEEDSKAERPALTKEDSKSHSDEIKGGSSKRKITANSAGSANKKQATTNVTVADSDKANEWCVVVICNLDLL